MGGKQVSGQGSEGMDSEGLPFWLCLSTPLPLLPVPPRPYKLVDWLPGDCTTEVPTPHGKQIAHPTLRGIVAGLSKSTGLGG